MPEIREGPTPFWGGRGEGAASGGRQAASKGRRAGGGGSKREREREKERETDWPGSPPRRGKAVKKKNTLQVGSRVPLWGSLVPKRTDWQ